MDAQGSLGRNLETLRRRNPQLADGLEGSTDEAVVVAPGPRGAPTLTEKGVRLVSAYAPEDEGRRMAAEMDRDDPDLMIALGFGLGHHLDAFRERNRCPLVVFEPSRARLRAALAARPDLELLSHPDVYLVDDLADLQLLVSNLYTAGLRIGIYPLPALLRLDRDTVRAAVDHVAQAKNAADVAAYTRVHMVGQWAWITAGNARALRDTPSLSLLFGAFPGITAVVACAGPSLTKQLPTLTRIRDRVLLIAIGQAVGALREAGLEPDLVHVLESLDVVHQLEKGGSSDTVHLAVTPDVDPSLFACPIASRFVSTPNSNTLARWIRGALGDRHFLLGGGSVAHGAVSIAAALGARRIVLLGQDLAFTEGQAYARGSAYADTGVEIGTDGHYRWKNFEAKLENFENLGKTLAHPEREMLWVDGWHGDKVPTSRPYASFIDQYASMAMHLERLGVELVNCTEGGARLPKVRHATFESIAEEATGSWDAPRVIRQRLADWSPPARDALDGPIASAREAIERLESDAGRAIAQAERDLRTLAGSPSPGRVLKLLKRTRRRQKGFQSDLDVLPWLDDVVQPELLATGAALLRTHGEDQTPTEAVESALDHFRAIAVGTQRARLLLDRIVASLEEDATDGLDAGTSPSGGPAD